MGCLLHAKKHKLLKNSIRYLWESFITLQFINITSCVNPKCVNTLILRYGTLCMKLIVIFRIHRIFNAEFERHVLNNRRRQFARLLR